MPREPLLRRRERALQVLARLDAHMPDATIELDFHSPLELLVAVILSAQCTDKRVNQVTPALFRRYPDAAAYASSTLSELESYIASCGLFRSKAKNLQAAASALVEHHQGQVPTRRVDLEALPGVGRKTAGVVGNHLGGEPAFPVDTHVFRVSRRLGLARALVPEKVEAELCALLPASEWVKGHQLLVWHGRRACHARAPACDRCPVEGLCPKTGLAKPRPAASRAARRDRP